MAIAQCFIFQALAQCLDSSEALQLSAYESASKVKYLIA